MIRDTVDGVFLGSVSLLLEFVVFLLKRRPAGI